RERGGRARHVPLPLRPPRPLRLVRTTMPLKPGSRNIGENIATEMAHGKSHPQAVAIALHEARRTDPAYAAAHPAPPPRHHSPTPNASGLRFGEWRAAALGGGPTWPSDETLRREWAAAVGPAEVRSLPDPGEEVGVGDWRAVRPYDKRPYD